MRILRKMLFIIMALIIISGVMSFKFVRNATKNFPIHYNSLIIENSKKNDLDPFLVAAVIKIESNYSPNVVSHADAHGLMQLLPETADWILKRQNEDFDINKIYEPEYNIKLGTYYLKYLTDYFGDDKLAIAGYNGGLHNVEKWLKNIEYSKDGKNLHEIPFPETKNYVKNVMKTYEDYKKIYNNNFPEIEIDTNNSLVFQVRNYKNFINDKIK